MAFVVDKTTSFRFSTDPLPPSERRAAVETLFERKLVMSRLEPLPDCPLRADITRRTWPNLGILAGDLSGLRLRAAGGGWGTDDLVFVINVAGTTFLHGPREAVLRGDATLTAPGDAGGGTIDHVGDAHFIGLRLPRTALAPLVSNLDESILRVIPRDTGALGLLKTYLRSIGQADSADEPALQRLFATHVHDLVALAIGATRDGVHLATGRGVRAARLHAIKRDIAENLDDSELTVAAVAARHRVTPRYVHKLFEAEGVTYSEFVRDQRLARSHRILTDPRFADRAISTIAYDVGFGDLSYFNRAFRRRYAATPSEVRRRGE